MTARRRKLHRFVETFEFKRFAEFCNACSQDRYIGVCYGPAGIGKTLSARRYANWDQMEDLNLDALTDEQLAELRQPNIVFYTAPVTNTPRSVINGLSALREKLGRIAREPEQRKLTEAHRAMKKASFDENGIRHYFTARGSTHILPIPDPATLILMDEADRLTMQSLEQARAIFDEGDFGLVLIGMTGLEKKLARYAQFYSRVGFVHEFRPLSAPEVTQLLSDGWSPYGIDLPPLDEATIAAVIRVSSGNFRLIDRVLTQMARLMKVNQLESVDPEVVEAARDTLVIGK